MCQGVTQYADLIFFNHSFDLRVQIQGPWLREPESASYARTNVFAQSGAIVFEAPDAFSIALVLSLVSS
jgi:hypothetical protein